MCAGRLQQRKTRFFFLSYLGWHTLPSHASAEACPEDTIAFCVLVQAHISFETVDSMLLSSRELQHPTCNIRRIHALVKCNRNVYVLYRAAMWTVTRPINYGYAYVKMGCMRRSIERRPGRTARASQRVVDKKLSCLRETARASCRVVEYFAKSLKVIWNNTLQKVVSPF